MFLGILQAPGCMALFALDGLKFALFSFDGSLGTLEFAFESTLGLSSFFGLSNELVHEFLLALLFLVWTICQAFYLRQLLFPLFTLGLEGLEFL